jgi:hypothetical protein
MNLFHRDVYIYCCELRKFINLINDYCQEEFDNFHKDNYEEQIIRAFIGLDKLGVRFVGEYLVNSLTVKQIERLAWIYYNSKFTITPSRDFYAMGLFTLLEVIVRYDMAEGYGELISIIVFSSSRTKAFYPSKSLMDLLDLRDIDNITEDITDNDLPQEEIYRLLDLNHEEFYRNPELYISGR